MTDADHAKTRTFKTKGRVTAAIDQNRAFKDVLKDDLIDLHKIGGGKFDNSIQQIISEYESNNIFPYKSLKRAYFTEKHDGKRIDEPEVKTDEKNADKTE